MKTLIFSLLAILCLQFAIAQPPAGDASPGDAYGSKILPGKVRDNRS